jgi:hypothetical protein
MSLRVDISIYNDKDMLAANHMPIAALPVPVAVLVRMPVGVIPIGIGMYSACTVCMYSGRTVRMDSGSIGSARMISTIGATNGRAAFSVYRRGGVFMVAGMAVPEESFVISFGDVLVSPHSISFSHTFSDGFWPPDMIFRSISKQRHFGVSLPTTPPRDPPHFGTATRPTVLSIIVRYFLAWVSATRGFDAQFIIGHKLNSHAQPA